MTSPLAPLGIAVGVDGSPEARVAVDWAAREAARRAVVLTLLHVLPGAAVQVWVQAPLPANFYDELRRAGQEILAAAAQDARAAGGEELVGIEERIVPGPAVPALVDASKQADMVVVGSRGLGKWGRRLLGSVSAGLVQHARCPVAVIRDQDPQISQPDRAPVVVGIDGSPASEHATAIAFDAASRRGVELVAVHTWRDAGYELPGPEWSDVQPEEDMLLAERLAGYQERYPDVRVRRVVKRDQPARALLEEAENAQLLVVGSHGRGGFTGMLLGSVSSDVVQSARVPVIVARP